MDERVARRDGYPLTLPDELLNSEPMRRACATQNFQEIFRLVNRRTGSSYAVMAAAIGKMTSSRIGDVIRGVRRIRSQEVIQRIADGFGIPGAMLGLPVRPWESSDLSAADAPLNHSYMPQKEEVNSVDRRGFVSFGTAALAASQLGRGERVIEALDVVNADSPSALAESLGGIIEHYALTVCATSSEVVYDEILQVRSYASGILNRSAALRQRKDIHLAIGWLSCLLGIAASDMGAHAAAHVWCADAERRSQDEGHPELAGWGILTRSMISFYQGRPQQSVILASQGKNSTEMGTAAHAKLAAQEMRAAAMTGDAHRTEEARKHAAKAMAKLPSDSKTIGAFSIPPGEEPPYTATSLMLLGRFRESVSATGRVIQTVYQSEARQRGENPSGYSRALLILALAQAGTGNLDEAVSAGHAALAGNPTWPTLALADKLNQTLERDFSNASQAQEFHARYLDVAHSMIGGHPQPTQSPEG